MTNQLFKKLGCSKDLDNTKINEIREVFGLEILETEIELSENCVNSPTVEIKEELRINNGKIDQYTGKL